MSLEVVPSLIGAILVVRTFIGHPAVQLHPCRWAGWPGHLGKKTRGKSGSALSGYLLKGSKWLTYFRVARAFLCHVSTHRLEVKKAALFRRSCLLAASDGRTKVIALLEDEAHAIVGPIQVTRPPGPALRPSCSVALLPIAAALCSSADGLRSRFPTHAPVCSPPASQVWWCRSFAASLTLKSAGCGLPSEQELLAPCTQTGRWHDFPAPVPALRA